MGISIHNESGRTELHVPHNRGTIAFLAPALEFEDYARAGVKITAAGLEQPTTAQHASLIHAACQNPTEKYSAEVISSLKGNGIHCFNGILWVPEGCYIEDRPGYKRESCAHDSHEFLDLGNMDAKGLAARLASGDSAVRFVPFDKLKGGTLESYSDLANNDFVVALAGKEGAEKLSQSASYYKLMPFVDILTRRENHRVTVASINSGYPGDVSNNGRLGICGMGYPSASYASSTSYGIIKK